MSAQKSRPGVGTGAANDHTGSGITHILALDGWCVECKARVAPVGYNTCDQCRDDFLAAQVRRSQAARELRRVGAR